MKNSTTIDSASWYLSLIKMIYLLFFPPFLKLLLQILTTKLQQIDKISKQYKATTIEGKGLQTRKETGTQPK